MQLCLLVVLRSSFVLNVDLFGLSGSFAGLIWIVLLSVHFICAEHAGGDFDLLFIFVFWVCTFCFSYFTELVVSTVDFIFLLYWKSTGDFSTNWGILCTATWKCEGGILKMYRDISLNLLVIHDIFIVYFFVTWILFCVIDRISVYLLFNWVLYLYFCPLCFVLELWIWYWKVQTWYLLLYWMRLCTDLCNWVEWGTHSAFCFCHEKLFFFCDIQVTKFPFPLLKRQICRNRVILSVLKNGVLGILLKFCTFQKLDYFILSQANILRLAIFQWVLYLTFVYFTVRFGECCFIYFCILIFLFVITFSLLFQYYLICFDF